MKNSKLILSALVAFTAALCVPASSSAASILGANADNFTIIAGTAVTNTNTVGTTISHGIVGGAVGVSNFPPGVTSPTANNTQIASDVGATIAVAITESINAYTKLRNLQAPAGPHVLSADLAGQTLTPGIYATNSGALVASVDGVWTLHPAGAASTLFLDAQGKDNVSWVINIGQSLTMPADAQVQLINPGPNGGRDDGIFWTFGATLTTGASNAVLGNYLAGAAINLGANNVVGTIAGGAGSARLMAQSAVTLDRDSIDARGAPGLSDLTGGLVYNGGGSIINTQTITFAQAQLPTKTVGNPPFTISATSDRGLLVSFASANPAVATVGSSTLSAGVSTATVTIIGSGSSNIIASQAGDSNNAAATDVVRLLTVVAASAPPGSFLPLIINFPLTVAGTVGRPFTFRIEAANASAPMTYSATGLPAGLSIVAATGVISGTPTAVGTSIVGLSATSTVGTGTAALIIVVAPSGVAPIITSPITAPGTVGAPFVTYLIVASGAPTSYTAANLPAGLSVNATTGAINGTPTLAGTYLVPLTATNSAGTGLSTVTITVATATVAPVITSPVNSPVTASPGSAPGTVGTPFVFQITATGLPTSFTAFNLPPGLSLNPLTGLINGTPTAAGTTFTTLTATNSAGTSTATLMIVIAGASATPIITSPTNATGAVGSTFVTYLIAATGVPTSYSATGLPPGLTLNTLTGAINGSPTVAGNYLVTITATNALGTSSTTLVITVGPNLSSRITNFSARAISGPGDQTLIMGFVVAGNGKNLLVRGVGPTLSAFGIANPLADPLLTLFAANTAIATNDDWSIDSNGVNQSATIAATAARLGAFALPAGSKDSALLVTLNNGAHTSGLLRPNSTTGVALTEIYDTDSAVGSRLINVSARMNVTGGEGTLIAGFVIGGTVPKTVLIRGVGPTLAAFGVNGVLADPQLAVYSGSTLVGSNDNWEAGTSTAAQVAAASVQVGAFALAAGSKDASMLITLQPGSYTVLVTGVGATAGVALIEIYDTQ